MPRAKRLSLLLCLIAAVGAGPSPVYGEESTPWQPVDQTVSDLDRRAASSRQVEQGIGVYGQTGSLYQRPNDGQGWYLNGQEVTQQYQMRQPGFTAWIDRPDYITQDANGEFGLNKAPAIDGQFTDLVPPNTVFDLSNSARQVFIPYADNIDPSSPRINTRLGGWANTTRGAGGARYLAPVAHSLPPHLMARRAQHATESQGSAEANGPEAATESASSDISENLESGSPTQGADPQPE